MVHGTRNILLINCNYFRLQVNLYLRQPGTCDFMALIAGVGEVHSLYREKGIEEPGSRCQYNLNGVHCTVTQVHGDEYSSRLFGVGN